MRDSVSIIIPIHNAQDCILSLVYEIEKEISSITTDYEFILVDDLSTDDSWNKILTLSKNPKIKLISFKENYGQHYAISYGVLKSTKDFVVIMDCDFQDSPKDIKRLYDEITKGFDFVVTIRKSEVFSKFRMFWSFFFFCILKLFLKLRPELKGTSFGIYKKEVIQEVLNQNRSYPFFPIQVRQTKYKFSEIFVIQKRYNKERQSSYSFFKLLKIAYYIVKEYVFSLPSQKASIHIKNKINC